MSDKISGSENRTFYLTAIEDDASHSSQSQVTGNLGGVPVTAVDNRDQHDEIAGETDPLRESYSSKISDSSEEKMVDFVPANRGHLSSHRLTQMEQQINQAKNNLRNSDERDVYTNLEFSLNEIGHLHRDVRNLLDETINDHPFTSNEEKEKTEQLFNLLKSDNETLDKIRKHVSTEGKQSSNQRHELMEPLLSVLTNARTALEHLRSLETDQSRSSISSLSSQSSQHVSDNDHSKEAMPQRLSRPPFEGDTRALNRALRLIDPRLHDDSMSDQRYVLADDAKASERSGTSEFLDGGEKEYHDEALSDQSHPEVDSQAKRERNTSIAADKKNVLSSKPDSGSSAHSSLNSDSVSDF